jgi:hypothetical protein
MRDEVINEVVDKLHAELTGAPPALCGGNAHTPGPWFAGGTTVWGSAPGSCRNTVADTATCGSITEAEDRANARLIAAAPELLAALQELVAVPNKKRPDRVWGAARAAILKATQK